VGASAGLAGSSCASPRARSCARSSARSCARSCARTCPVRCAFLALHAPQRQRERCSCCCCVRATQRPLCHVQCGSSVHAAGLWRLCWRCRSRQWWYPLWRRCRSRSRRRPSRLWWRGCRRCLLRHRSLRGGGVARALPSGPLLDRVLAALPPPRLCRQQPRPPPGRPRRSPYRPRRRCLPRPRWAAHRACRLSQLW